MRIILQRVSSAAVVVDNNVCGEIGLGFLLLIGFGSADTEAVLDKAAEKTLSLRLFPDAQGRFHYTLEEVSGGLLAVPQFTLYADCSKGRRPDFFGALAPEAAEPLFERFVSVLGAKHPGPVACGVFGAQMQVQLINDGPVTILLEF